MSSMDLYLPPMDREHTILSTRFGVGISMALVRPRGPRARPSASFPDSNEEVSIYSVVDFQLTSFPPSKVVSA